MYAVKTFLSSVFFGFLVMMLFYFKNNIITYLNTEQLYMALAQIENIEKQRDSDMPLDPWGNHYAVLVLDGATAVYSYGVNQLDEKGGGMISLVMKKFIVVTLIM